MTRRSAAVQGVSLLALGTAAWFALAPSDDPPADLADTPTATPSAPAARSTQAKSGEARPPELYKPRLRTDRVSVVGERDPVDTTAMSAEEIEKLGAVRPLPPSPEAKAVGEAEKERRREESRRRREARAAGEDPGRAAGRPSPGELVNQAQEELDEAEEPDAPQEGSR